jgi:hypothetical protein
LLVEAHAVRAKCKGSRNPPNNAPNDKGEAMKTFYVRILSAFFALAAFAATTRAQEADQLIVNVHYDFVVAGKTLPAGTYRVSCTGKDDLTELAITGVENRAGALFLSTTVDSTHELKPALTFEHVGDQYFLSKIETAEHIFTITLPAKAAAEIAMKNQNNPSTSSSSRAD